MLARRKPSTAPRLALQLPPVPQVLADADRLVDEARERCEAAQDAHRRSAVSLDKASHDAIDKRSLDQISELQAGANANFDISADAAKELVARQNERLPLLAAYARDTANELTPAITSAIDDVHRIIAELDARLLELAGLAEQAKARGITLPSTAPGSAGAVRRLLSNYVTTVVKGWK